MVTTLTGMVETIKGMSNRNKKHKIEREGFKLLKQAA